MNANSDKIRKSLKTLIKNTSVDGSLRHHRLPLHIILWLMAFGCGFFNCMVLLSPVTIGTLIISFILSVFGTVLFPRRDYGWFLYFAYNLSGGLLCCTNIFFAEVISEGMMDTKIVGIFCSSTLIGGIISYRVVTKRLNDRWKRIFNKRNEAILWPFVLLLAIVSRLMPMKVGSFLFLTVIGFIIGIIAVSLTTIYFYGKIYDPQAEMIRQVEEEAKVKAKVKAVKTEQRKGERYGS